MRKKEESEREKEGKIEKRERKKERDLLCGDSTLYLLHHTKHAHYIYIYIYMNLCLRVNV